MQLAPVDEDAGQAAVAAAGCIRRQTSPERQPGNEQDRPGSAPSPGDTRHRVVPVTAIRQPGTAEGFELLEHVPPARIQRAAIERDAALRCLVAPASLGRGVESNHGNQHGRDGGCERPVNGGGQ
ncbi:hypothetical protein D3C83_04450 [compost metagenome]